MDLQPVLARQTVANAFASNAWVDIWSLPPSNCLYYGGVRPWSACFDIPQKASKFYPHFYPPY